MNLFIFLQISFIALVIGAIIMASKNPILSYNLWFMAIFFDMLSYFIKCQTDGEFHYFTILTKYLFMVYVVYRIYDIKSTKILKDRKNELNSNFDNQHK